MRRSLARARARVARRYRRGRRMALAVALFSVGAEAAACEAWCNVHTCSHEESCAGCEECHALAIGKHCEKWCNGFTCGDQRCSGCDSCSREEHAAKVVGAQRPAMAERTQAAIAPPGWDLGEQMIRSRHEAFFETFFKKLF